ncbi:hypothetical protein J3D55_003220 [Chryseobacterium ginsenosidimutans]|nr:hypothetical protein [Chryseobacterium ginsenosidimutans]MCS3870304.1 hypothetical protein [Chryseobacterium ginsenosidimutans]
MYPKIYLSAAALLAATLFSAQVMISKTAGFCPSKCFTGYKRCH